MATNGSRLYILAGLLPSILKISGLESFGSSNLICMPKPKNAEKSSAELLNELKHKELKASSPENEPQKPSTTKTNLPAGYTRVSIYVVEEFAEKAKAYAYWHRISFRELIDNICSKHLHEASKLESLKKYTPPSNQFIKTTIVIQEQYWEKIRDTAWLSRTSSRHVLSLLLYLFLKDKQIDPIPLPPPSL